MKISSRLVWRESNCHKKLLKWQQKKKEQRQLQNLVQYTVFVVVDVVDVVVVVDDVVVDDVVVVVDDVVDDDVVVDVVVDDDNVVIVVVVVVIIIGCIQYICMFGLLQCIQRMFILKAPTGKLISLTTVGFSQQANESFSREYFMNLS